MIENPKSPYYTDPETRLKIDILLKENARIESNLGLDSTKKEFADAKVKQDRLFTAIKLLDLKFYKDIVIEEDRD